VHAPDPVYPASLKLPGKANSRAEGGETRGLGDDAGDQVIDVPASDGDLYRPAEDITEQQREHDRLHHGKKNVGGYSPPDEQVPLRHNERIFDHPAGSLHKAGIR
jgi:hypothetical protein